MAGSNDLIDKLSSLPKWQMVGIAVGVLLAVGIPAVYFGFGMNKKPKETQQYEKVLIDIPDAIAYEDNRNRMQTYDDVALEERRSAPSRSYWDDLSQDIVSNSKAKADDPSDPEYLDPSVYSPAEIKLIRAGFKTKAQIDREHEEAAREVRELAERSAQASRKLTPEQKDSIYWAKVEKSMEMTARIARKYQDVPEDAEEDNTAARPKEEEPQESERKIDLGSNTSALPANAMGESDIITSLVGDGDDDVVHYSGTPRSKPVKATFLKNETISSGQRVIIRLMQELTLRRDCHPCQYAYHRDVQHLQAPEDRREDAPLQRPYVPYGYQRLRQRRHGRYLLPYGRGSAEGGQEAQEGGFVRHAVGDVHHGDAGHRQSPHGPPGDAGYERCLQCYTGGRQRLHHRVGRVRVLCLRECPG